MHTFLSKRRSRTSLLIIAIRRFLVSNTHVGNLLEHLRIAQWDILDFIVNPEYQTITWPDGYWPKDQGDAEKWNSSVKNFRKDRKDLEAMVEDNSIDLYSPIPHAPDYTIFREIVIVIDHNFISYWSTANAAKSIRDLADKLIPVLLSEKLYIKTMEKGEFHFLQQLDKSRIIS